MLLELDHGLTERDGVRTPDVPGRSTAHTFSLAGLHALQKVVVLLLLAGLLRPVEEVVLGDGDVVPVKVVGLHVEVDLVLQPDPGEGEGVGDHVVELWVVENNSVVDGGLQKEEEAVVDHVRLQLVRVEEGVAHPVVDRGHLAVPHGLLHHGVLVFYVMDRVLDGGVTREGLLLDTALNS